MRKTCLVLFLLCLLVTQAHAAVPTQCYSPEEVRAEQLLRLHSELMVITVTCRQGSKGENLVPYYTGFTQAHLRLLHDAEQTMEKHYKICYGGDGIDSLDKLRTKLGNEYSQKSANVSAPFFCSEYRDFVIQMYRASASDLTAQVNYLTATEKPYERLCPAPAARIAKKAE